MKNGRFLVAAIGSITAVMLSAAPALADDTGYHANPNASVDGQCHGAFGAFSHNFQFSPDFQPPTDAHADKAAGLNGDGNLFNPNAEKIGSCG